MKNRELKQLIKVVKETPEFGATDSSTIESGRVALLEALGETETARPNYNWKNYAEYINSAVFDSVAKPLAVGISSLVLAFGGWIFVVNASSSSVPGDTLYPFKIATERVQLTFATSGQQRTKLAIDFAGRRLNEVDAIQSSDLSGKDVRVRDAMDNFRMQMASVNSQMKSISENNPEVAAELAGLIDAKTQEYANVLRDDVVGAPESQDDLLAAKTDALDANKSAVQVLVDSEETQVFSSRELQELFQEDLHEIEGRLAVISSRLEVIEDVLEVTPDLGDELISSSEDLVVEIRKNMLGITPQLTDARSLLVAGGFRSTFEIMNELKTSMTDIDNLLAKLEIQISVGMRELDALQDAEEKNEESEQEESQ